MEINNLRADDYERFLDFHSRAYPTHEPVQERFQHQFLENPLLHDKSKTYIFLAYDQKKNIIGQYGVNPMDYSFGGVMYHGFCGCDLFVEQQARKYGAGGFLSMKAIRSCSPHFSIGVSKEAKPVLLSLQMKKIGEAERYLWLRIGAIPKIVARTVLPQNRNNQQYSFQNKLLLSISEKEYQFTLVTPEEYSVFSSKANEVNLEKNKELLAFSRSPAFIKWRFFNLKGYYLYRVNEQNVVDGKSSAVKKELFAELSAELSVKESDDKNNNDKNNDGGYNDLQNKGYFVVKVVNWKNLHLLAIVDIQADLSDRTVLRAILAAAKKIARENKVDGIITLSSHVVLDRELRKSIFIKVWSPYDIYTNVHINFPEEKIKQRTVAHITMVDSDLEFCFWQRM